MMKISPINNKSALVQAMAVHQIDAKPTPEVLQCHMVSLGHDGLIVTGTKTVLS